MSTPLVKINERHDKSVDKLITRNAKKLSNRFSRKKKVEEGWLKSGQTVGEKVFSIGLSIITVVIMFFAVIFSIGTIYSAYNKTAPTFFGYSTMRVASGSMSAETITINGMEYESGFEIGDTVVIRGVDKTTLKPGDKIAFYVYSQNYIQYHQIGKEEITVSPDTKTKYKMTFGQFFGFQTKELTEAAKNDGMLTFHHITNIYRDTNGKLWFKTQGSANASKDVWYISEDMIVGIYSKSVIGNGVANVVKLLSTSWGLILLLLIPIGLLTIILIRSFAKDLHLALLELDVVEGKRKLTDKICVKNKIGYRMDKKTKYKVLAQATNEEKLQYISLLWPNSSAPNAIKKYVITKKRILESNKKLFDLDRECEKMFNEGKSIEDIATHYTEEKEKIEQEQLELEKRFREKRRALRQNMQK